MTPEKLGYSFNADLDSLAMGDTVVLNGTHLCVISKVTPFNITADHAMAAIVESLHPEPMGMIPMFNFGTGELSTTPEFAYGALLRQGDWVISTETGMLGKVIEVAEQNTSNAKVTVRCLMNIATKKYVDQALAALEDLAEVRCSRRSPTPSARRKASRNSTRRPRWRPRYARSPGKRA